MLWEFIIAGWRQNYHYFWVSQSLPQRAAIEFQRAAGYDPWKKCFLWRSMCETTLPKIERRTIVIALGEGCQKA